MAAASKQEMTSQDEAASTATLPNSTRKPKVCHFYNTKTGCRAGNACRFLHVQNQEAHGKSQPVAQDGQPSDICTVPFEAQSSNQTVTRAKVVARPVPQAETADPRAFQLAQIQRRFKPSVVEREDATVLTFGMKPSDPDFPYEIDELECVLNVPKVFPAAAKPQLRVANKDIPRGFQINIERGFDAIAVATPTATLLSIMNRLDRQLETILAGRTAETVTIVPNRLPVSVKITTPTPIADNVRNAEPSVGQIRPSEEERAAAHARRQAHTRQLEARFSRLPSFHKSADGQLYTLPLLSQKKATWPPSLQALATFDLQVSQQYPLDPATVRLVTDSEDARNVEEAFKAFSRAAGGLSLTQLANHLVQHLPDMAKAPTANLSGTAPLGVKQYSATAPPVPEAQAEQQPLDSVSAVPPHQSATGGIGDRTHIHIIPRPPEWGQQQAAHDSSSDDETDSDDYTTDEAEEAGHHDEHGDSSAPASTPLERGILLSFPHMELYGIELLEITSLSITIKCERCKDTMDVQRLRSYSGDVASMRQETCKKCASVLAVGFRADLVHANSVRGGYLDLDGCTVIDMLPSNFTPTCAECSTALPAPGVVSVRGDSSFAICRECHRKMTFRIVEVKFLQVSATAIRASKAFGQKKKKENLGITAGTQLPRRGRCSHYAKVCKHNHILII
ncbi:hypothetical protein BAUCODRAFT_30153 [Baudoinia panamericana UAMH 10762]|uniref:C3H1-type domain-containing protein n=1 Tax=Baudoinia panamericana (strain UAMH 10762) TaxID=717646 RepID=M2NJZ7_BAUPA|nr:uncharacterized protein BAUCODRAFT_30153 [Baudoinia panamericana UAMH 10762]EMC99754.1 hypothetical protein BAUCODRAFT_30153 [Baudoinia panamericana UAMH 10762]